jgi:hypothetical protein
MPASSLGPMERAGTKKQRQTKGWVARPKRFELLMVNRRDISRQTRTLDHQKATFLAILAAQEVRMELRRHLLEFLLGDSGPW